MIDLPAFVPLVPGRPAPAGSSQAGLASFARLAVAPPHTASRAA